ncbi:MAG TPA: ATP-binding protein [Pyrinomonadaceae bacterium]|jgi:signal transduction histidine kinase|nr:ATP-binding protein [Pyrinomonadaceae bacterium]
MYASRLQIVLAIVAAFFLLGTIAIFIVFAVAPDTALVYRPLLLTGFVVMVFVSMVCMAVLMRGLLRPYNQLIGEAQRAPVAHSGKRQNEAAFVLETFQSVIVQLQQQQQELKRLSDHASQRADSAEAFSDHIVASMPTGLLAFDATGQLTLMNGPAHALFPGSQNVDGKHFKQVLAGAPALVDLLEKCLSTGRVYRREEIETTNGLEPTKRLGATIAPIEPTSETAARGALCLVTDITEVSRLREQVALKNNLESLGEMSAGLAHEFKNAMAALHGYAQFLQTIDQDEQGRSATEALLQEVRNLSEMTTAFLNFARPQTLQLEDVSVDELIHECIRELTPLFESRNVECIRTPTVREGALPLEVRADNRMLRQALLNLIRNAAEAITEDQAERQVTIESFAEQADGRPWARISISDTGPGIAAADLKKIFIPFFTTKSHGHGIGLALAHRVITEHGGTLTAASSSTGAVFTIRLPCSSN